MEEKYNSGTGKTTNERRNFDPMTGRPLKEGMNFNPMTGEPLDSGMNFNPMTGEPINNRTNFDPATGRPVNWDSNDKKKRKKSSSGKIVIAVAVVAVVLAASVFGVVKAGVLLSKPTKVLLATANTLKDTNHLLETAGEIVELGSDEYTIGMDVDTTEFSADADLVYGKSRMQVTGSLNVPNIPGINGTIEVNEDEVLLAVPSVTDYLFTYDYKNMKTGYLAQNMGDKLDMVDTALQSVFSSDREQKLNEVKKLLKEEWKSLEFEKAGAETFQVDGKDRTCKGYAATVTSQNLINVLNGVESIYGAYINQISEYGDAGNVFSEMRNEAAKIQDMDITFFIYKNKLACIRFKVEYDSVEFRFLGGTTRTENIQVWADGELVAQVRGSTNGSEETINLLVDNEQYMNVRYDYKSGDYNLNIDSGSCIIQGKLLSDKNNLTVAVNSVQNDGMDLGVNASAALTKGAAFTEVAGQRFDLGNATEEEFQSLAYEFKDLFY